MHTDQVLPISRNTKVRADLLSSMWTDGRTDMMTLTAAFRSSANAANKQLYELGRITERKNKSLS